MRNHATTNAWRRRGLASQALLVLALAALAGCGDNDATGPVERAAEPVETEELAPGLGADLGPAAGAGPSADQSTAPSADQISLEEAATRLPRSFFVNPTSGKDTNPGTKALPFRTLARALSTAIAKDTIRLASGDYSAAKNGERFNNATQQVRVPAGVMILGALSGGEPTSRLRGSAGEMSLETGLNLEGAAIVRNIRLTGFSTGIRATQGVQRFKNLILDLTVVPLDLSGLAQSTLVGSTVFTNVLRGVIVREQAQFTMDGGTVTGGNANCRTAVIGVQVRDAGRVTLRNGATLRNIAGVALSLAGTSKALLTSSTTIDGDVSAFPLACTPPPAVIASGSAALTLQNAHLFHISGASSDVGILSSSDAPLTITGSSLQGYERALLASGNLKLAVSGSTFDSNHVAIDATRVPTGSITITGSRLTNNVTGIHAPFFKLRSSVVSSNQTGILLTSPFTDLGQTFDPGNNTITGNTNTGVTFDVNVISGGVGGIFASGNTWNASTQDSDESGHYPKKPLLDNSSPFASGKNFILPTGDANDLFQIQL